METGGWIREFCGAATVCDADGVILEMIDKAARTFEKDGGRSLIGKNLLDCHEGLAHEKLLELLRTKERNVYTIEKNGIKKMIYQSPWFEKGEYRGFVELSLEIPFEMPHFVRKAV